MHWILKIVNRILVLEDIPPCFKNGTITPIYKKGGRDPLSPGSYRGITISSVLSKILETPILSRITPMVSSLGLPDILQTAYQKGLSCSDATFATQEALVMHLREGGHPYLCLFDIEKAFDSIEFSVLLSKLFNVGLRGKCWRIIMSWYTSARSRVQVGSHLSDHFTVSRGVKQGSVLSPLLFILVIDTLLKDLRTSNAGISIDGSFVGGAAHADDLHTIAPCTDAIAQQLSTIDSFTSQNHLSLNPTKTEIVKISLHHSTPDCIKLPNLNITTVESAKCLGVWWQYNLSAERAVQENISKARRAFFAFGKIDAFHGNLNPLSTSSIYDTCVLPILLYGCETWLLNTSSLSQLERFQAELGRRILKLPSFFSTSTVHFAGSLWLPGYWSGSLASLLNCSLLRSILSVLTYLHLQPSLTP